MLWLAATAQMVQGALLEQNVPTTFTRSTEIRFTLPAGVGSATLHIYNLNGGQVASYPIQARGQVA